MDESYLQWLGALPGLGPEVARRIAERFPTYDYVRAATRDELASVEGLTSLQAESLFRILRESQGRDESGHLFLCTECGSFVGTAATECPFCGAEFEGGAETDLGKDLADFLREEESPARICQTCGAAMGKDATACTVCGRSYRTEELALLPGLAADLDETSPFCARCGAYLFSDEAECAICGTPISGGAVPAAPGASPKGVVKDFLNRWQRIAEAGAVVSDAERLQEQLEHYDRLLEADSTLERAWANRSKVLEKLGRPKEAAESLAKAAEFNPAKDEQYRLEVQNILRSTTDVPVLPPRWRQPAATAVRPPPDARLLEALDHYDSLLRADSSLVVAWRTKAEILERLGRSEESRASHERADLLDRKDGRSIQDGVAGLHSNGLATPGPTGAGRTNGRVNGVRNGRTNGRVNGRTNGRVNGLAEGRVNGLTTGAVNGLTFGRGATNGLVNGNGFTNGRRGRPTPLRIPESPHWSRSVVGIAAVVALMVIVPILASMLSPGPTAPGSIIRIDGDFGDWASFPSYGDSPTDQVQNPSANLVTIKVVSQDRDLFVNAAVQGILFGGLSTNETESLFVFVDEDNNPRTGYPIGDIGSDAVVEVYGWIQLGVIEHGLASFTFDSIASPRSNDWRRFVGGGSADAAFSGSNLEMRITVNDPERARVLVYAADNLGNRDPADASIRPLRPTVVVGQQTIAPDVVSARSAFLRVTLGPLGGVPQVAALNLTRLGTSTDPVDLATYRDDGNGVYDAADIFLSNGTMVGTGAGLPLNLTLAAPTVLWVEAAWTNATPTRTFGLSVGGLLSNGTASFRSPEIGLVYLGSAPTGLRVDGAFGDWRGRPYGQDLLGDVTNRTGAVQYNANVDLIATAADVSTNFTGYVRVDGRLLGGQDIPTSRGRTTSAAATDSDLDGVPDWVEQSLGPGLARDFNNDNLTDDQTGHDVDADATADYPDGMDCWLNTTIPAWYPAPYAGNIVTRYICPIGASPQEGVDVVYAYIDSDNTSATGYWSDVAGRTYGFDYAIAIIGRNGAVNSSGLYGFAPGRANPWQWNSAVAVALDAHRMEFAVAAGALNLTVGYRVVYYASDWRLGYDVALPDAAIAQFPVAAQAATNAVINEVSPQPNPERIEIANPLSSSIPLNGWNLVIRRGGTWVVVFTFTTQVLGPFGSGSEYLSVSLAGGSLPNGVGRVRLRQGTTVIDETSYPRTVNNGQSWSRFKDPVTGVPMDTNNDAADFYTSTAPSPGRGNDRHRPTIIVAKTVSRAVASPGDVVTYAVYYNNTNTGMARTVWVNDTLPAGVAYTSSSVPYNSVSGATHRWIFASVMPGQHSFTITARVTANTTDGQRLMHAVTLNYTDQLQRLLPASRASTNTTVARPMVTVVKTATPASARPGDLVTFTIFYNNTGSVAAGTVTIKDSLPTGMDYRTASPAPTWTNGRTFFWNFTNVAPGPHSLTLTAQVNATFSGSTLVTWAFLNYTTPGGFVLNGSRSSATVAIPELSDMIFVAAVPLIIIGLKTRARRARKE